MRVNLPVDRLEFFGDIYFLDTFTIQDSGMYEVQLSNPIATSSNTVQFLVVGANTTTQTKGK